MQQAFALSARQLKQESHECPTSFQVAVRLGDRISYSSAGIHRWLVVLRRNA
jgi:hypothetical protein